MRINVDPTQVVEVIRGLRGLPVSFTLKAETVDGATTARRVSGIVRRVWNRHDGPEGSAPTALVELLHWNNVADWTSEYRICDIGSRFDVVTQSQARSADV